jgi:hypothetical protein
VFSELFSEHLNQTVSYEQFLSQDGYNKPTFSAAQTVAARVEGRRRMVTTLEGENIISSTTVFTQTAVTTLDKIDSRRVLEVMNMVDGEGNIIGYEVLLQ